MGLIMSRLGNMGNSWVFGFDAQLDFKKSLLDRQYTAAASKQAEILAQLPAGGGGGGGVAGFNAPAKTWISFGNVANSFAPIMILVGLGGAAGTWVLKGSQGFMFISLLVFVFFFLYKASYMFLYSQQNNIATGTTFMVSMGTALAVSFAVAFFIYSPAAVVADDAAAPAAVAASATGPKTPTMPRLPGAA
jgi:hypothetical protein